MTCFVFQAARENMPEILKAVGGEISRYVSDEILFNRLKICVEEIVTNISDYAYPDGNGKVYISCEFDSAANALRFGFEDDGTPYDPLENRAEVDIDADISERRIGGLGIFLYTSIMDKVEYRRENGRNHLTAVKYIERA